MSMEKRVKKTPQSGISTNKRDKSLSSEFVNELLTSVEKVVQTPGSFLG